VNPPGAGDARAIAAAFAVEPIASAERFATGQTHWVYGGRLRGEPRPRRPPIGASRTAILISWSRATRGGSRTRRRSGFSRTRAACTCSCRRSSATTSCAALVGPVIRRQFAIELGDGARALPPGGGRASVEMAMVRLVDPPLRRDPPSPP